MLESCCKLYLPQISGIVPAKNFPRGTYILNNIFNGDELQVTSFTQSADVIEQRATSHYRSTFRYNARRWIWTHRVICDSVDLAAASGGYRKSCVTCHALRAGALSAHTTHTQWTIVSCATRMPLLEKEKPPMHACTSLMAHIHHCCEKSCNQSFIILRIAWHTRDFTTWSRPLQTCLCQGHAGVLQWPVFQVACYLVVVCKPCDLQ